MEIRYGKNHSVHNLLFLSYLLNVDQIVCQMLNISPRTLQTLRDNGTFLLRQAAKPSGPILKSTVRCTISLRMWSVFFMLWLVEIRIARCVISKRAVYE